MSVDDDQHAGKSIQVPALESLADKDTHRGKAMSPEKANAVLEHLTEGEPKLKEYYEAHGYPDGDKDPAKKRFEADHSEWAKVQQAVPFDDKREELAEELRSALGHKTKKSLRHDLAKGAARLGIDLASRPERTTMKKSEKTYKIGGVTYVVNNSVPPEALWSGGGPGMPLRTQEPVPVAPDRSYDPGQGVATRLSRYAQQYTDPKE